MTTSNPLLDLKNGDVNNFTIEVIKIAPSHDIGCLPEVVYAAESELGRVHVEVDHRVHRDGDAVPGKDLEEGGEGGNRLLLILLEEEHRRRQFSCPLSGNCRCKEQQKIGRVPPSRPSSVCPAGISRLARTPEQPGGR